MEILLCLFEDLFNEYNHFSFFSGYSFFHRRQGLCIEGVGRGGGGGTLVFLVHIGFCPFTRPGHCQKRFNLKLYTLL